MRSSPETTHEGTATDRTTGDWRQSNVDAELVPLLASCVGAVVHQFAIPSGSSRELRGHLSRHLSARYDRSYAYADLCDSLGEARSIGAIEQAE